MKHIHICPECKAFTMKELCLACNQKAVSPKPPKYSPEDKYAKYRRETLQDQRKEKGLV